MIIKVCGMREAENIRSVAALQPDYMGFIFYPQSKRYAAELDLAALGGLEPGIHKTGVFVNESMDGIADKVLAYQLEAVQLHGDETPEFCRSLAKFLHHMQTEKKVELIKAFGISPGFDFSVLTDYEDVADMFLFDTKTAGFGGSGQAFDWSVLSGYHGTRHYLLSGGLSLDNLAQVHDLKDARLAGVDLNSKFEIAPGLKDVDQLKKAFNILVPQGH